MIPKKIHYCWYGRNSKTSLAEKCISSWRKFCPDYDIIEWNEDNFDLNMNGYTHMCYEKKKYAFLSDYARLYIVAQHGGFYFDTDVELIRSIDDLCWHKAFIGFETDRFVNTGQGFGSEVHNPVICAMLKEYDEFLDGTHGMCGCPYLNTRTLEALNLIHNGKFQELENITVYPKEYFNPYDDSTGILNITVNSYSIHWYSKSWMSKKTRVRSYLMKPIHRFLKKVGYIR